jgi:hypothetical protein
MPARGHEGVADAGSQHERRGSGGRTTSRRAGGVSDRRAAPVSATSGPTARSSSPGRGAGVRDLHRHEGARADRGGTAAAQVPPDVVGGPLLGGDPTGPLSGAWRSCGRWLTCPRARRWRIYAASSRRTDRPALSPARPAAWRPARKPARSRAAAPHATALADVATARHPAEVKRDHGRGAAGKAAGLHGAHDPDSARRPGRSAAPPFGHSGTIPWQSLHRRQGRHRRPSVTSPARSTADEWPPGTRVLRR